MLFSPSYSVLLGCQKSNQSNEKIVTPKVEHKIKSITEYKHKVLFGEPEKEGVKEYLTILKYDSLGKLQDKSKYKGDGSLYEKYSYQYDSSGRTSIENKYEWYKDFKNPTVTYFSYNKKGNIIEHKEIWDKTTTFLQTYSYDSSGNLTEYAFRDSKGKTTRTMFKDHDKGHEIENSRMNGKSEEKCVSKYISDSLLSEKHGIMPKVKLIANILSLMIRMEKFLNLSVALCLKIGHIQKRCTNMIQQVF